MCVVPLAQVRGQKPDRAFSLLSDHIRKVSPLLAPGLDVKLVRIDDGNEAYWVDRDNVATALSGEVLDELYGSPHFLSRGGGSVPVLSIIKEKTGIDSVNLAFGLPDEQVHAPDERYRLSNMSLGRRAYIRMILKLSKALTAAGTHTEL